MFFKRFYDESLAQASYLIGCQATGDAIVVDPNRDIQQYIDAANAEGLRLAYVTETHIHADFVSGARELAALTGARLLLSREGGPDWQSAYAAEAGARLVGDGDTVDIGNIRIEVMHTPGHTPEHISFLVTDRPASAAPWGILTGDFVFVGDVGRPDLLERAAGYANTMEAGAHALFRSLARFRALPDHVQVWPGHGAGSACGKALGAVPSSTVGYEKISNWGVATTDEATFVHDVLAGQPEPPVYFARMKRINKVGPAPLARDHGALRTPAALPATELDAAIARHATVVDTRLAEDFAAGYVAETISIPLNKSFTTWAGWLVPYDREILLVAEGGARARDAARALAMIGLDRVSGYVPTSALLGRELSTVPQATPQEVARLLERDAASVIDVRGRAEYGVSHLPGVPNIPVGYLVDRITELPTDRPVVVQCQAGTRSAIAASVLLANGVRRVINLAGGIAAWERAGLPVTSAA